MASAPWRKEKWFELPNQNVRLLKYRGAGRRALGQESQDALLYDLGQVAFPACTSSLASKTRRGDQSLVLTNSNSNCLREPWALGRQGLSAFPATAALHRGESVPQGTPGSIWRHFQLLLRRNEALGI